MDIMRTGRKELMEQIQRQAQEIESLKAQLAAVKSELEDRTIRIAKAGTIMDASMSIHRVLDAVKGAAEDYLYNLEHLYEETEQDCMKRREENESHCAAMKAVTEERCAIIREQAEAYYQAKVEQGNIYYEEQMNKAASDSENMKKDIEEAYEKLHSYEFRKKEQVAKQCQALLDETQRITTQKIMAADEYYAERMAQCDKDIENHWDTASKRMEQLYQEHIGQKIKE